MRVILDASVLVAALMADGRARHVIQHSQASFHVPASIYNEALRQAAKIAKRARIPISTVRAALELATAHVETIPDTLLGPHMQQATRSADAADAPDDAPYVAAALALAAPVWSYDDDFKRMNGINLIHTTDIEAA